MVQRPMTEQPRGIDLARLVPWFREHVATVDALEAEVIGHGRSNITYRLSSDGDSWVLRRPPMSHVMPTAHDMKREYTVLSALAGSTVPVPHTLAFCPDEAVNDAPFYVMERVDGTILRTPQEMALLAP